MSRELDVLLDVEDQIVDERLVWIIREDDLYRTQTEIRVWLENDAHSVCGIERLNNNTYAPSAHRTLRRLNPAGHLLRPTRARSSLREALDYVGETQPARAQHSTCHRKKVFLRMRKKET